MTTRPFELEATWEEIAAHGPELMGRRVRLVMLPGEQEPTSEKTPVFRPACGLSTARSLLTYAGTWEGDDLEECLRLVYENRGKAWFGRERPLDDRHRHAPRPHHRIFGQRIPTD